MKQMQILTSYTISHAHAIPEQVLVSVFKTTKHREKEAAYLLASIVERPSNHAELSKAMASLTVEELQTMFSIILSWNDAGPIGFRPSLGPLVHFVSALLDAHFITILQDAALSDLVVRLHKELQGLTQLSAALAGLKGSLTMVRREQDRAFKPLHNEKEMKQMRKAKKSMIEDYQVELLEV